MPKIYNMNSGDFIGEITQAQLQFLLDQLEEEDSEDTDYYINADTLAMLREADGDPALIDLLEKAMGDKEDLDIEWK
jgi:hypothetical protein